VKKGTLQNQLQKEKNSSRLGILRNPILFLKLNSHNSASPTRDHFNPETSQMAFSEAELARANASLVLQKQSINR
jgi:hypothetical protein